jgi:hypothetical protein
VAGAAARLQLVAILVLAAVMAVLVPHHPSVDLLSPIQVAEAAVQIVARPPQRVEQGGQAAVALEQMASVVKLRVPQGQQTLVAVVVVVAIMTHHQHLVLVAQAAPASSS